MNDILRDFNQALKNLPEWVNELEEKLQNRPRPAITVCSREDLETARKELEDWEEEQRQLVKIVTQLKQITKEEFIIIDNNSCKFKKIEVSLNLKSYVIACKCTPYNDAIDLEKLKKRLNSDLLEALKTQHLFLSCVNVERKRNADLSYNYMLSIDWILTNILEVAKSCILKKSF